MDRYIDNLHSYSTLRNSSTSKASAKSESMALASGKKTFLNCRLCLTEIQDNNVTLLDGIIKDMLEIILPELNFSICDTSSLCKACLETLKQSYSFKSSCLEVEDRVQDLVNPKTPTLIDLKEVLKKTDDIKQISERLIVCRTCLGLGEESLYTKLCSYEGDPLQNMVEKCLPELGLILTKDPSICPMCLEQLEEQFHFIMQCLDTETKITFYSESKRIYKDVDLHNVYLFSICLEETDEMEKQYGPDGMENGHCDRESTLNTEETITKNNYSLNKVKKENANADLVDLTDDIFTRHIKNKVEKCNNAPKNKSKPNLDNLNVHLFGQHTTMKQEEVTFQMGKDEEGIDIITSETSRISHVETDDSDSDMSVTKESELLQVKKVTSARLSPRKSEPLPQPTTNKLKHRFLDDDGDRSEEEEFNKKRRITRKCKICDFKTKFGSRMKAHMTRNHKVKILGNNEDENPARRRSSDERIFKCGQCPYTTPDQGEYKAHKHQHRREKEQKCPHCTMVFVRPDFLKRHIDCHGNANTTLITNNLIPSSPRRGRPALKVRAYEPKPARPVVIKPPSFNMSKPKNMNNLFNINGKVLKMFKCRLCPYQTRLKSNHDRHGMSHKKTTEIVTHRCKLCNFETIQRENFLTHMQTHDNDAGNKVMRCFLCSFQPATELELKQHVNQVHKSGTG